MSQKSWEISRRAVLRGMGATVALPLLEQMLPGVARAATAPVRRLVVVFVPCGIHMPLWTPAQDGAEYALTPILEPLAPVKEEILVVSGLANRPAYPTVGAPHAGGTGSLLTARKVLPDGKIGNGISMDQVAARQLGKDTQYPSLELGLDAGGNAAGACEGNFSCAYVNNISWASETLQMSKEVNPKTVFARLFGATSRDQDPALRKKHKRSILDLVRGDAERLNQRLGQADRLRMDEYLTGVRELERRLDAKGFAACKAGDSPAPVVDLRDHTKAMLDLMTVALRCDLTRVMTFMMGNGASARQFPFLGITGQHHALSHHQEQQELIDANVKINRWEVEQFAYFVQALKATKAPTGGNLLDDSAVLFVSEMGDPNSHDRLNIPVLLAGRAGGQLKPGRHLRVATEQPLAKLHLSLLNKVGVAAKTFGEDGTEPLPGL